MKNLFCHLFFILIFSQCAYSQSVIFSESSWGSATSTVISGNFSSNPTGNIWSRNNYSVDLGFVARVSRFTVGTTQLTSSSDISTLNKENVIVTFKEWVSNAGFPRSQVSFEYSTNSGTNWIVTSFSSLASVSVPTTSNATVTLTGANNISTLRVRFNFNGISSNTTRFYYVDDISISASQIPRTYYNNDINGGDLSILTSWGINSDGSGENPSFFTSANQTFMAINGSSAFINDDLPITGNGSSLTIGDGTNPFTFTINDLYSISAPILGIQNNATIVNNYTSPLPTFTTSGISTVEYNYDGTDVEITPGTYYNLKLSGTANKLLNLGGSYTVSNTLDVSGQTGNLLLDSDVLTLNGIIVGTPIFSGTSSSQIDISKTGGGTVGTIAFDPASYLNILNIIEGDVVLGSDLYLEGGGTPAIAISSGATLDAGSFTIHGSGSNSESVSIDGTLKTSNLNGLSGGASTTFDTNVSAPSFLSNSTVEYKASSGSQAITAFSSPNSYQSLTLSGGATKTFASATYLIDGNFTKSGGGVTINPSSAFVFNGSDQNIAAINYPTVTFSGSGEKTLATDVLVNVTNLMVVSGTANVITNNNLVLSATSASQNGYILDYTPSGGVSGSVNVQRIVPSGRPGTPSGISGLPILVSSPVSGSVNVLQNSTSNFFYYVPGNATNSRYVRVSLGNPLVAGQGFLLRKLGGHLFQMNGSVNNGNYTQSLSEAGDRYNLIGNPYPSPITWDATNLDLTNLASSNQYRIYTGSAYVTQNVGSVIPMGQGFFVQAAGSGASVTFKNASRGSTASSLFRTEDPNLNRLELWLNRGKRQDMAVFWAQSGADSRTFINKFDGNKMNPTDAQHPVVSFPKQNQNLDVFTYGLDEPSVNIPINTKFPKDTIYSLNFKGLSNLDPTYSIFLKDSLLNVFQDLRSNDTYSFSATTATGNRFRILVSQVITNVEEAQEFESNNFNVFSDANFAYINMGSSPNTISISDLTGIVVFKAANINNKSISVNMQNNAQGIYIVTAELNNKVVNKKFIFNK